eukprot:gene22650-1354_t
MRQYPTLEAEKPARGDNEDSSEALTVGNVEWDTIAHVQQKIVLEGASGCDLEFGGRLPGDQTKIILVGTNVQRDCNNHALYTAKIIIRQETFDKVIKGCVAKACVESSKLGKSTKQDDGFHMHAKIAASSLESRAKRYMQILLHQVSAPNPIIVDAPGAYSDNDYATIDLSVQEAIVLASRQKFSLCCDLMQQYSVIITIA